MLQQAISFSFPLFSFIFSIVSVSAQNSKIYIQCSKSCFASMTPYESNVISLFTSLVDSATVCNFNKFAICPTGYSQNNSVYGLFQCRGDLSSSDCKECVMSSITQLKATCPVSTGGAIQLDGCFVKYDNISFFGDENRGEVLKRCGPPVGYNSDDLSRIDSALAYLIAGNGKYFRACDYGGIQGVAQCVQDLSVSDCQDCLSEASGKLRSECAPSTWGDMYLGKCFIRYADQVNGASSDGNTYTGSSSSNSKQGSKHNSRKLIGYIVGGSIAGVILTLAFTLSLRNCCNLNIFKTKIKKIEVDLKGKAKEIEANKKAVEVNQRATEFNQKAIEVNKRGVEQNRQSIEAISRTVAETGDDVEQNRQSIEAISRTVAETRDGVEQNRQSIEAISSTVAETRDGVEKARRLACEAEWKAHEAMRYAYYDRSYCHHGCVGNCHRLSCKTIPLCLN